MMTLREAPGVREPRESAVTRLTKTARNAASIAALVLALTSFASPSYAYEATAEQRAACTPDVFRLCSGEIPNVDAIIACMNKQKANLSPPCKAVFHK